MPGTWGNTQQWGLRDPPTQQSRSHHMSTGAGVPSPWSEAFPEGSPQHLWTRRAAGPCPAKSHTSPGRVSIRIPEDAWLPGAEGTAPPVPGGLSEQAGVLVSLEVTGLAYTRTAGPEPVVRGTVELQS